MAPSYLGELKIVRGKAPWSCTGSLRAPAARCPDRFMKTLRKSLQDSRLPVTYDPDAQFMLGRHPA